MAAEIVHPFSALPNLDAIPTKPTTSFGVLALSPTPPLTPKAQPQVLGTTTFIGPIMTQEKPTILTPLAKTTRKSSMTIALLGDSMIDTLGSTIPTITRLLKQTYPSTTVTIKNFGVGGTGISYGIKRITEGYTYKGVAYPSLVETQPDVVIIESFGYNPFGNDEHAMNTHWLLLAKAVDTIKQALPETTLAIAATIAPNAQVFGDGAEGLAFSSDEKWQRVTTIKSYLDNAVRFAKSEHLPLANAYTPSLLADGNGNSKYISPIDHIHYSDSGRTFMATILANTLIQYRLLE